MISSTKNPFIRAFSRYYWVAVCCALFCLPRTAMGQDLKAFQLPNGLHVFVWEDPTATNVHGMVACKVGAKDDPSQLTGLAHYLEHVMFKGTQKIGALDWEKEAPLYEQIIATYDAMAAEPDAEKKAQLNKEINRLTVEAAQYSATNEFSTLTEGMGGTGLNAGTSYDYTVYYNTFPAGSVYKWLELNSERLINPVFRSFQTELETVYEEYNRSQNNQNQQTSQFLLETLFSGHPYSRPVLGFPEHIKNPQLSALIDFYHTWYTPQNMALILVGKVDTREVLSVIREKFGRLPQGTQPTPQQFPTTVFKGRKEFSAKVGRLPQVFLAYPAVPGTGSVEERIALEIATSILSNSSRTGLLDKLGLDGEVIASSASYLAFKDEGRIIVNAVPFYDISQRRFSSHKATEKILLNEIAKLRKGKYDEWLIQSIKGQMIREFDLNMESQAYKAQALMQSFVNEQDLQELLDYKEIVASITPEQIQQVANKYFSDDYFALFIQQGKPDKKDKIEKPGYDPISPKRDAKSDYAKLFELMPMKFQQPEAVRFDEVQQKKINDLSVLYYTPNPKNDIFTLRLRYGIGTEKMPSLDMAVSLMNNAGILGQLEAQQVKQEFSNYGTTCFYSVDDSYLEVVMYGFEAHLKESCQLLSRQILFPKLDEKQMDNLKGMAYQARMIEKESSEDLSQALLEYMLYHDKSDYLDRPEMDKLLGMTISQLTGDFQRATDYEAEVHYCGTLSFDEAYALLSANLPLKAGEKPTESPIIKDRAKYSENTVYFLPDRTAQQASIYFFIEGRPYDKVRDVYRSAFNQYFGGGFNGLVMQEIREFRSMAYTAIGSVQTPQIKDANDMFVGYVGTQSDKVYEALDVYTALLSDMPLHPDRMANIKNYLREWMISSKPEFRQLSSSVLAWKRRGYAQDPLLDNLSGIENLSFDDIVQYYKEQVQAGHLVIAITGDPKLIDIKALEKYGKVERLSTNKVLSSK